MIGTYDVVVIWLGVALALAAVVVCIARRFFLQYFFVNLYLLSTVLAIVVGAHLIRSQGYDSAAYYYFYYTADAVQNVIGYLLVASLFDYLFRHSAFYSYVRLTLGIFFLLVIGISLAFVFQNYSRFYSSFMIELQQNMFFVGVLLTFLLWIAMNYLRVETRRFVLLVSGLGIYFSAHAANYAMQYLFPSLAGVLSKVPPLAYTFMVSLWLYAFWRVPEGESVLEPVARGQPPEKLARVHIST